jgi:murein DD-endopeptidase MepM/ murein hydrolase activator NlpD
MAEERMKTCSMLRGCLFAVALLAGGSATAQRAPRDQGFDLQVPWQPSPARTEQAWQLAYELHLTNFANKPLRLRRLTVLAADTGTILVQYEDALSSLLGRTDLAPGQGDVLTIPPGVRAVVYIDLPMAQPPPKGMRLTHRLDVESTTGDHRGMGIQGGAITLASWRQPVVLAPPLRGGYWAAIYDPSWTRGHRRTLYAVDGAVHVPGRFAVDWIKVDSTGHYTKGDATVATHWMGYGEEVLAGADATVAAAVDGMPEPGKVDPGKPTRVPLQDASGNYVSLDLGDGRYAFYEHLKTGSVTVKAGQKVRRGDVIGRLGYSGETTGPHLHMHVADRNDPLNAEGLPFVLDRFGWLGDYDSIERFAQEKPWLPSAIGVKQEERFPRPLSVVTFTPPYYFFKEGKPAPSGWTERAKSQD